MKILITAGATWIKIDEVRIITNRFTGKSGVYLWQQLKKKGHAVTLLVNPHCLGDLKAKSIIKYQYFNEFEKAISTLLQRRSFDVIIHMAAVSDYRIKKRARGKIPSGKSSITLDLIPTEKIIAKIRKLAPSALVIQFKLEPYRRGLVDRAYESLVKNKSNFAVANALQDLKKHYKAFLVDRDRNVVPVNSLPALVRILNQVITEAAF